MPSSEEIVVALSAAAETAVKELEELCASDEQLSIETLRENICQCKRIFDDDERNIHMADISTSSGSPFFHHACLNQKVTLEIIEYLLESFPDAAEKLGTWMSSPPGSDDDEGSLFECEAYPLHCCAYNDHCQAEVIKLLIDKYPAALEKFCSMEELFPGQEDIVEGLPLHYFLARQNNMEIGTVKMIVEAYPQALLAGDSGSGYKPLHIAAFNPNVNGYLHVILPYLLSVEPSIIQATVNKWGETLLHIACGNKNGGVEVVELLCADLYHGQKV